MAQPLPILSTHFSSYFSRSSRCLFFLKMVFAKYSRLISFSISSSFPISRYLLYSPNSPSLMLTYFSSDLYFSLMTLSLAFFSLL